MLLACTYVLLLILPIILLVLHISLKHKGMAGIEKYFNVKPDFSTAWVLLKFCWVFTSAIPSTELCRNAVDAKIWLRILMKATVWGVSATCLTRINPQTQWGGKGTLHKGLMALSSRILFLEIVRTL